ncbi:MAG: hypothetical protein H6618_04825 [Deltaproteobacteria bacterium]|nr:hypothetical protein [Deltaproteobacteria bacterium]
MKTILLISILLLGSACQKSSSEDNSASTTTSNAQVGTLLIQPKVTPPVQSNTPDNFQSGFQLAALRLQNPAAYQKIRKLMLTTELSTQLCGSIDRSSDPTKYSACVAAAYVKESFFLGEGPSDLASLTQKIDSRMEDIFRNNDWSYMPCFDENNTAGGSYYADNNPTSASVTKEYPAFSLVTMSPEHSFSDGTSYNLGMTAYLSCKGYLDGAASTSSSKSWVAFGRKDGNYYIHEGSTAGLGSLAQYSSNGNLELFFALGSPADSIPDNFIDELAATNNSSTGLIHMKSFADTGLLELTMTGSGFNSHDCGTHIITNGSLLFIKTNENTYGACSSDDDGVGTPHKDTSDGNRSYDSSKSDKTYCIDVSGSSSISAFDSTTPCEDQGLTSSAFALDSLSRSTFKSKYAGYLFSKDPDINEVIYVPVQGDPVGEDTETHAFEKSSISGNTISTSCGSSGESSSFELKYSLNLASDLSARIAAVKQSNATDFDETAFKEKFNERLKAASDAKLSFSVSASAGGIKWADFDMALKLSIDGQQVASANYQEADDHTKGSQVKTIDLDLSGISSDSTFTLTASGSLGLGCTTSSGTGTASVKLGFPRLTYTAKTEG